MDDVVNRFARELADAIAAAVAENPQVEACREKARAAGFEMKVTLEAVVGFVSRSQQSSALAARRFLGRADLGQCTRRRTIHEANNRFERHARLVARGANTLTARFDSGIFRNGGSDGVG